MNTVIYALSSRVTQMRVISDYFCQLDITGAAKDNFKRTIREGRILVRDLKLNFVQNSIVIDRIENFLVACEETLIAAGLEVLEEYCEIEEILEEFRDYRFLTMRLLSGKLNDLLFS